MELFFPRTVLPARAQFELSSTDLKLIPGNYGAMERQRLDGGKFFTTRLDESKTPPKHEHAKGRVKQFS